MRNRAWRRKQNFHKAIRKRKIDLNCTPWFKIPFNDMNFNTSYGFYKNLHQYSKNKIHCSCPICREKTKDNGITNYSIKDKRKKEEMDYEEE